MLRNRRIRNVTPKAYTPFEDHCTYVLSELSKKNYVRRGVLESKFSDANFVSQQKKVRYHCVSQ